MKFYFFALDLQKSQFPREEKKVENPPEGAYSCKFS